jgi:hypothetical protein
MAAAPLLQTRLTALPLTSPPASTWNVESAASIWNWTQPISPTTATKSQGGEEIPIQFAPSRTLGGSLKFHF